MSLYFLSGYTAQPFEGVCLWSVKAVKWCCHINMSRRDPISSPRPLADRTTSFLLKSLLACTVWLFINKQTETKDSPNLACRNPTLWKPKKKEWMQQPAAVFHLTTHSFWIALEYMRTSRQRGVLPWFLMYDYFIWTGEGAREELSVGVIDTGPH